MTAGGQVVLQADAGEDAVNQPDGGGGCRYETAHLGHQHDNGYLPNEGGLAGHVGAGNQHNLGVVGVQGGVVGDECAGAEDTLHYGMPAVGDADSVAVVEGRPHVTVAHGDAGQPGEHVGARHRSGQAGDAFAVVGNLPANLAVEGALQFLQPLAGFQRLALVLFQLRAT